MPLKESEAIVLRSFPLGEADRLVSFLSRTEGRLRGVARGARRTKNQFGSTLEILSHVRIWFYERETRDLVRISQCELVESFYAAQGDYDRSIAFALISEVVEAVLPEHEAADPVFRLVLVASRAISEGKGIIAPLAYFGLWSARLAGWLPSLDRCENCGRAFSVAGAYLQPSGELVCSDCKIGGELVSEATLQLGRRILAEKLDALFEAPSPETELKKVIQFSLDIIEREIDRKLSTRKLVTLEEV
ncbi:MAG TPA: DNA repair protein RecO [Candidatus Acidoferrales bacterium]|jgi:DNA repair protein RecO (recombination protein O)|nr:DNA repair protein RecO [Candidatus Acidoferrales bacterium]